MSTQAWISTGFGSVHTLSPLVEPLVVALAELAGVLTGLDDEHYVRAHNSGMAGTVGGHVRHSLDHVAALLTGLETGQLNYDDRQRGTAIEIHRKDAIDAITQFSDQLRALPPQALDCSIVVSTAMSPGGPTMTMQCPARRELAFVLSHTIHHNAMIAALIRAHGGWTPRHFGYASSTLTHLARQQQIMPPQEQLGQLQQKQQQQ